MVVYGIGLYLDLNGVARRYCYAEPFIDIVSLILVLGVMSAIIRGASMI